MILPLQTVHRIKHKHVNTSLYPSPLQIWFITHRNKTLHRGWWTNLTWPVLLRWKVPGLNLTTSRLRLEEWPPLSDTLLRNPLTELWLKSPGLGQLTNTHVQLWPNYRPSAHLLLPLISGPSPSPRLPWTSWVTAFDLLSSGNFLLRRHCKNGTL